MQMLGIENVVELSRAPKRRNTYYSVLAGRGAVNAKVACYSGSLVLAYRSLLCATKDR